MVERTTQAAYWNTAGARKVFTHPLDIEWLANVDHAGQIVDYGCGYGRLTAELTAAGFTNVLGVDISHALIEKARQRHTSQRNALHPHALHHHDLHHHDPHRHEAERHNAQHRAHHHGHQDEARQGDAGLRFAVLTEPPVIDEENGSVDAVLLFAVLTCLPSDVDQLRLLEELKRVLRPGGLLYISDLTLANDERNQRRYAQFGDTQSREAQTRETQSREAQTRETQVGEAQIRETQSVGVLPFGTFLTEDGALCRHHEPAHLRALLRGFEVLRERVFTVATMNGNQAPAMQLLARLE